MKPHYYVSIILRSYNDAALLPRTLAALHQQQGITYQLIVVESASTDNSPAILQAENPDYYLELPAGRYWSSTVLNNAMHFAKNDIVVFLNSDAVMMNDTVLWTLAHRLCTGRTMRWYLCPTNRSTTCLDDDTH